MSKRPRKSKTTESHTLSSDSLLPIPTLEQLNIQSTFAQALLNYKTNLAEYTKQSQKDLNHLNLFVQEHLSSYALIGFTMNGDRVTMINTPTPRDEGAIIDLMRSIFIELVNNRP
jgi:hypothetical protein